MRRTIFSNDFAPYYPIGLQPCPMYVNVANRIHKLLVKEMEFKSPDTDKLKKEIAINIAIYYEDKMSNIGLWNTFVEKHLKMYGYPLPFVDNLEVLDKEDVNADEVKLLIWMVLSRYFQDKFLNPLAIDDDTTASIIRILEDDDEIEINKSLYDFIYDKDTANDYFKLKKILFWLRRSYLLCSPLANDRYSDLYNLFNKRISKNETFYYVETMFSITTEIGPLSLPPHIWLAEMYYNHSMDSEASKLKKLKYCQQDIFLIKEINTEFAILKDSLGKEYKLKNNFPTLNHKDLYVTTSLVLYGDNNWEINGFMYESDHNQYRKNCEHKQQLAASYKHNYPHFMKRTKGKRIAFFENIDQLKDWLHKITPNTNINQIAHQLPSCSQVGFISQKAGIIFAPDIIHAIKCKDNPYYKKCDDRQMRTETMNAVINIESTHPELLNYLLENNMLQDGDISYNMPCKLGNEIFTHNIDFIARNHRRHYYHDHDY